MTADVKLIWEAYSAYKLPDNGQIAFGDFYIMEYIIHTMKNKHKLDDGIYTRHIQSSHILDNVQDLFDNITEQLAERFNGYLKTVCLQELTHLADNTHFGWIYSRYSNAECSLYREDPDGAYDCIMKMIKQFIIDGNKAFDHPTSKFEISKSKKIFNRGLKRQKKYSYDHILSDIESIYEEYGKHIVLQLCQFISKTKGSSMIDDWETHESNSHVGELWEDLGPNLILELFHDHNNVIKWEHAYGGDVWGEAVKQCNILDSVISRLDHNRMVTQIDHIYDLEHNSGQLLSKSDMTRVPKRMLDARASSSGGAGLAAALFRTDRVSRLLRRFNLNPDSLLPKGDPGTLEDVSNNLLADLFKFHKKT